MVTIRLGDGVRVTVIYDLFCGHYFTVGVVVAFKCFLESAELIEDGS